jgi:hypothetical protein
MERYPVGVHLEVTVFPLHDPLAGAGPSTKSAESRGYPRYRVLQRCIVRPPGVGPGDGWQSIVFSLSTTGVGITFPLPIERGADVEIEACDLPETSPLKARVVHVARFDSIWLAGCELTRQLTGDDLTAWLTSATDGP